MKCPNDQSEMEKGKLVDRLIQEVANMSWMGEGDERTKIIALKCPKCGKVELYTETEKEEK
ncbi:hypothetical protein HYW46_00550 [Candidatus Daviesbacteria bacterium]|nr:hypothetical protein [Candidatus Daviesbacteria bacterium]